MTLTGEHVTCKTPLRYESVCHSIKKTERDRERETDKKVTERDRERDNC